MFKGREYFAELGLYDMRARFYHPQLGRFLQGDPIGFGGGDANLFRYCHNDPVNRQDPSGLFEPYATTPRITVVGSYPGSLGDSDFNINQGAFDTNNAGPDERSYPEQQVLGDGPRLVPPITPLALPEDDTWQVEIPADLDSIGSGLAGAAAGSDPIGGMLGVAGTYTEVVEQTHGGSGYWLSRNSWSFNSDNWGGNGATGPRARALGIASKARLLGKGIFAIQIYLSVQSMMENPTAGNITHQSVNIGMGAIGFAGPVGFAASTIYTIVDETVGWEQLLSVHRDDW